LRLELDSRTALDRIANIVGPKGVVADADAAALLTDARAQFRGSAALIVQPSTIEECAQVVRTCAEARLGIVPQGGNTGYCGGATPFDSSNQILLNLSRLNRVRDIDPVGYSMTVEAGLVLARAREVAGDRGLLFPLSMGSEGSCQIGGNLATNAGGIAVLRYGMARDLVLGLEVVLPNGEVVSNLKGLRKDNAGFDLNGLFVGAEGTLGVITAAVLKLFPRPRSQEIAWIAVADVDSACDLVARARQESGDCVVSAEYVSRASLALALEHSSALRDPLDKPYGHYLLLELASAETNDGLRRTLEEILEVALGAGQIGDAAIAASGRQAKSMWALRETIPAAERGEGGSVKHDISIRVSKIPEFVRLASDTLGAIAAHRLSLFGHIGDGNLHYNILPPLGMDLATFNDGAATDLSAAVYRLVDQLGGSFSAEHGIGVTKRAELRKFTDPVSLELMRSIKMALDPNGIMNPGKVLS
jgi:FAD/FMN-containing dehydrogenase